MLFYLSKYYCSRRKQSWPLRRQLYFHCQHRAECAHKTTTQARPVLHPLLPGKLTAQLKASHVLVWSNSRAISQIVFHYALMLNNLEIYTLGEFVKYNDRMTRNTAIPDLEFPLAHRKFQLKVAKIWY